MHIDFQTALDPEQYAAVTTTEGPVLIIAGAGSGKTRVITYRIAYLLSRGVPQEAILALTFTNKAASEMVQRAHDLTGLPLKNLMVSTFHSFGAWMLRREATTLGYRPNFSIYDEDDRIRAIRESAHELGFPTEDLDPVRLSQLFSARRAGYEKQGELSAREMELYERYRKTLKVYNAVDFDDLIALPLELLQEHDDVRARYRARFRYVMIDEFQDTSLQQYAFIRQIESGNICVVGDDDQSIYSWRGADFRNIERFELDHPGLFEIKLERNYRSTGSILTAANTVIAHNTRRKKKQLWSPQGVHGTPIMLIDAEDDEEEAERIIATIRELRFREHADWDDIGILVRTNSLAEGIEEKLVEHNVPYRVAGGPSFYQRREVKDIVAYLKAAVNPDDDVSVLRVLNVPRRGIGPATIEFLSNIAKDRSVSLRRAAEMARQMVGVAQAKDGHLQKALSEVYAFFDYLAQIRMAFLEERRPVSIAIRNIVEDVGYWQYLLEEHKKNDKVAVWKYRNIELLAASAERWEKDPDTFEKDIFAYLARISLTVRDEVGDAEQRLSLLTIHAAKGLEFDYVFIPGCENGILPHARSVEESGDIEEERRLFYVAVTRAKRRLFISRAMQRKKNGSFQETTPSPFLNELPQDLIVMADKQAQPHNEDELRREFFSRLKSRLGA